LAPIINYSILISLKVTAYGVSCHFVPRGVPLSAHRIQLTLEEVFWLKYLQCASVSPRQGHFTSTPNLFVSISIPHQESLGNHTRI